MTLKEIVKDIKFTCNNRVYQQGTHTCGGWETYNSYYKINLIYKDKKICKDYCLVINDLAWNDKSINDAVTHFIQVLENEIGHDLYPWSPYFPIQDLNDAYEGAKSMRYMLFDLITNANNAQYYYPCIPTIYDKYINNK